MNYLLYRFKSLPDGIRNIIFKYLPRHKLAKIIFESLANNTIKLRYVKFRYHDILGNYIVPYYIKELRPTFLKTNTYGKIIRYDISVGEKVKFRRDELLRKFN